jgi:acyl-CoA synthetase (NDP forming)
MAPRPLAELLVNLRRDPQFGLILTLGAGGVLVELLDDAETLLLPATEADILHALQRLKIARLLTGYRGSALADLPVLAQFLVQLAAIYETEADTLTEIEINPLFVTQTGVWVVDALIQTTGAR